MTEQEIIGLFKKTKALLEGHFILRSGLRSRQYFQCAHLLQYPDVADQVAAALAEKLKGFEFTTIISPAMGGILVGQDVARHLKKRHIFAEKENGVLKLRRFSIEPEEKLVVVEDVVTTGSAVRETCHIVNEHKGRLVAVGSIVDRSDRVDLDFGAPFVSLLKLKVETFDANHLPEDLQKIPPVKPGSK